MLKTPIYTKMNATIIFDKSNANLWSMKQNNIHISAIMTINYLQPPN